MQHNYCSCTVDFKPKIKAGIEDLLRNQVAESFLSKSRRRSSGKSEQLTNKIKCKAVTNKTVQWPCLPPNKLGLSLGKKIRTNAVHEVIKERPISRKSTTVHEEIIRSRDLVFEVCSLIARQLKGLEVATVVQKDTCF
jgi:hypothetical protein